jgi:hypothetical protein
MLRKPGSKRFSAVLAVVWPVARILIVVIVIVIPRPVFTIVHRPSNLSILIASITAAVHAEAVAELSLVSARVACAAAVLNLLCTRLKVLMRRPSGIVKVLGSEQRRLSCHFVSHFV